MIELRRVYIVLIIKQGFLEEAVLIEAYELACIGNEAVSDESSWELRLC